MPDISPQGRFNVVLSYWHNCTEMCYGRQNVVLLMYKKLLLNVFMDNISTIHVFLCRKARVGKWYFPLLSALVHSNTAVSLARGASVINTHRVSHAGYSEQKQRTGKQGRRGPVFFNVGLISFKMWRGVSYCLETFMRRDLSSGTNYKWQLDSNVRRLCLQHHWQSLVR